MRSEPSPPVVHRSFFGALAAAGTFVLAHAALLRLGRDAPWSAALAFAATDGVLWFAAAPLAMALGRRLARGGRALPWQLAIGVVVAPLFGAIQGDVSIAVGLRAPVPALASAFFYLDLNVAVLVVAAVALEVSAARLAMARHSRRFLALEARLLEVRHDLLTLQLQPHFLFNALNSVVELMRESPSEAARVLRDLRTLFLATTQRSSQAAVSLAEELNVVDAFIGVARARHADSLSFTREVDEAALTASVPPLSLQPLVENAIQFALQSEAGARAVSLLVRLQHGRLYVRITNSRSQRDRPSGGLGIGLRNTRERLAHLFGRDHALTLTLTADRAIAELDVPFVPLDERSPEQRLEVTDEFAAVANPVARAPVLPRWIGLLPSAVTIVGFWTLVWLFWVLQIHFYRVIRLGWSSPELHWSPPDLVSAVSWMALTPIALYLARRFPVQGPRPAIPITVHVLGALGAATVNVGAIVAVFGLDMVPMNNVLNQVVVNCAIYTLLVVWAHAEPIARWFDERQTATRRLQAELARARWEATEMRLSPEAIAGELDRLAGLVEVDAAGAEDDVLDMADALRRRLKGSESPRERASGALRASMVGAFALAALSSAACAPAPAPATRPAPASAAAAPTAAATPPSTAPPAAARAPNEADVNFVSGMIGHHAQALVMAGWAPSHGASASVRVLCERIINEQRDEIASMQTWLRDRGLPVPEAKPGPMRMKMNGMEHDMLMPGMLTEDQMKELDAARGAEFDRLFLKYMIQHHQGAVTMVQQLFDTNGAAQEQSVYKLASDVSADQTSEITRMKKMLASLTPGAGGQ